MGARVPYPLSAKFPIQPCLQAMKPPQSQVPNHRNRVLPTLRTVPTPYAWHPAQLVIPRNPLREGLQTNPISSSQRGGECLYSAQWTNNCASSAHSPDLPPMLLTMHAPTEGDATSWVSRFFGAETQPVGLQKVKIGNEEPLPRPAEYEWSLCACSELITKPPI